MAPIENTLIALIQQARNEGRNVSLKLDGFLSMFPEKKRQTVNDADRLRKYLAKFDLTWEDIHPK